MAKTLQQVLGSRNLTGVIQGVKGGVPADLLPPAFMRPTRRVEGDHCVYKKIEGTRKTARLIQYGAPSKRRAQSGVTEVPVKLMHSAEHQFHEPSTLLNLLSPNGAKQKLGQAEISRQVKDFKQIYTNLRMCAIYSIFRFGAIYFDGDGNLLPTSSSAVTTIDLQIPAGNKGQLDALGAGAIIAASWATAGTAIHTQIKNLRVAARKLTGYPLVHAFYGTSILDYFLGNTKLKELLNRNQNFQAATAGGDIPNGLLGFQWHPISEAFFEDNDGTNQDWFGTDTVVFTPEPSPEWWEVIEGSYPVPTDIGRVSGDASSALGQVMEVNGMFSYATVESDPVTIKHVAGDTFLPIPKVPKAMFLADVTP